MFVIELVLLVVLVPVGILPVAPVDAVDAGPAGSGAASGQCRGWRTPVDAPIVDPFRPPANPYGGGGNRGLEFGTGGGEPVIAVDDGRVTFVGPVGGDRWLVVAHDSGLRSTYGPLATTTVIRGESVVGGSRIGTAGPGLHLTARAAGRYLDPAPLLDGSCGRARLVARRALSASREHGPTPADAFTVPPGGPR